jgi:hypothetical protein
MTYSIFYEDGWPSATKEGRDESSTRIETFLTEHEALKRAFRLLDDGTHHALGLRQLWQRPVRRAPPTQVGFFRRIES